MPIRDESVEQPADERKRLHHGSQHVEACVTFHCQPDAWRSSLVVRFVHPARIRRAVACTFAGGLGLANSQRCTVEQGSLRAPLASFTQRSLHSTLKKFSVATFADEPQAVAPVFAPLAAIQAPEARRTG